jgi:hypothetical protein
MDESFQMHCFDSEKHLISRHVSLTNGKYAFFHNGSKIYEWQQDLDSVSIFLAAPTTHTKAKDFDIQIQSKRLKIGIKRHDRYFIDEEIFDVIDTAESSWFLDDGIINIFLVKSKRGQVWEIPLFSKDVHIELDDHTKQEIRKDLMLERFNEENPGFDFRNASFNGSVPDPRDFMNGVKYN